MKHEKFDGFIVTGAPVELLDFEDVSYWDELSRIYAWTQTKRALHLQHLLGCTGGPLLLP